jgi:purine-nucleoside phosphorylase
VREGRRSRHHQLAESAPELGADVAVIFGSGLAAVPDDAVVEAETSFAELGWPSLGVPGHEPRVLVVTLPALRPAGGGRALRVALVFGRPHVYEGWREAELERPLTDLFAAGMTRALLTNAGGGLAADLSLGDAVVATELVDLQQEPTDREPPRLRVCDQSAAVRVAAALAPSLRARPGVYVAVPGPQYETPAEAAWLRAHGDVVGMSTAPEVRVAARLGIERCLVSIVVNKASAVGSHDDVVAAASESRDLLAAHLAAMLAARWPDLTP